MTIPTRHPDSLPDPGDWEDANNAYLTAGLAWLRERLDNCNSSLDAAPDDEQWWSSPVWETPFGPPALESLAIRLGLSRFESLTLLLCVATELAPDTGLRCATASGSPAATYPTFALAMQLLPNPSWDAVSPHRPLRYWRLVNVHELPGQPMTAAALTADERIVHYVKGLQTVDARLEAHLRPVPNALGKDLVTSHEDAVAAIVESWVEPASDGQAPVVELIGSDPLVRRSLAACAAGRIGFEVAELPADHVPMSAQDTLELLRLIDREMQLAPFGLYIDVSDLSPAAAGAVATVAERATGPVLLGGHEPFALSGRRTRLVTAARPSTVEQQQLWCELLGASRHDLAARLADAFDLNPFTIRDCAEQTPPPEPTGDPTGPDMLADSAEWQVRLWDACRDQTRPRLAALAQRVDARATWSDLVLPGEEMHSLRLLVAQVRGRPTVLRDWGHGQGTRRGSGITALFAGQSGTGKTFAAEVLAHELRLSLFRVDLSGVVSKYIGETERNLRQVFDAAEEGGALLFFDEADALFGKRSDVKDSHDRYANIEVNYLLQRMEDYRGVAILATNQRQALDQAFLRRLRFVVTFPFPSHDERLALWRKVFPTLTPTWELDFDRLATLPATGGMIRNIALNAAFCAAGNGEAVTMELILDMSRNEFHKLQMPFAAHTFAPARGTS